MSGAFVPYQLRINKAVDRHLFIEAIQRIARLLSLDLRRYGYVGMGGPFLEDFRLVYASLEITNLLSLETSQAVVQRQEFNKPLAFIQCKCMSTGDYVTQFNPDGPLIIWFDYTDPQKIGVQIREVQGLIAKLQCHDILKITVNANVRTLGEEGAGKKADKTDDIAEQRQMELKRRLGEYYIQDLTKDDFQPKRYPATLFKIFKYALGKGMEGRSEIFVPLTAFTYNDYMHPMLSFSGIICLDDERSRIVEEVASWPFRQPGPSVGDLWGDPQPIRVPNLSLRERLAIEQKLPKLVDQTVDSVAKEFAFVVEGMSTEPATAIRDYATYARYLPYLVQVIF
ncbi:MAG: hypothetical protein K6U87_12745 [Firmicutes bacterium]|nr:hypothetical protein [Bacillota bacterium]